MIYKIVSLAFQKLIEGYSLCEGVWKNELVKILQTLTLYLSSCVWFGLLEGEGGGGHSALEKSKKRSTKWDWMEVYTAPSMLAF